jgi:integrase
MSDLHSNQYGSVRAYTRHTSECPAEKADNSCRCAKWLYTYNKSTGQKRRRSLNTPSWLEAQGKAEKELEGMNPEIAAARAQISKRGSGLVTVADACQLWVDRTINRYGEEASVVKQYQTLKAMMVRWADAHGICHIQEVEALQLERWYASADWRKLSPTTRSQRWGCVRSMFHFFEERGLFTKSPAAAIKALRPEAPHAQGPYSDEQIKTIMASVEASVPFNLPMHQRATYAPRIRAFMSLLLETGCDVSDAVQFRPDQLESMKVGKRKIDVYRYERQKTGIGATIPISAALAKALRKIPLEAGTTEAMPFRTTGLSLKMDQKRWSNRVNGVIEAAGVKDVKLPDGSRKDANVKQFRHTAAVRWLTQGQRPEEVARMLGHVDTEMVRKHYAPWCPRLDEAHIHRVVALW